MNKNTQLKPNGGAYLSCGCVGAGKPIKCIQITHAADIFRYSLKKHIKNAGRNTNPPHVRLIIRWEEISNKTQIPDKICELVQLQAYILIRQIDKDEVEIVSKIPNPNLTGYLFRLWLENAVTDT